MGTECRLIQPVSLSWLTTEMKEGRKMGAESCEEGSEKVGWMN